MDGCMQKPIMATELLAIVDNHVDQDDQKEEEVEEVVGEEGDEKKQKEKEGHTEEEEEEEEEVGEEEEEEVEEENEQETNHCLGPCLTCLEGAPRLRRSPRGSVSLPSLSHAGSDAAAAAAAMTPAFAAAAAAAAAMTPAAAAAATVTAAATAGSHWVVVTGAVTLNGYTTTTFGADESTAFATVGHCSLTLYNPR